MRRSAAGNLCIAVEELYEGEYREIPIPQNEQTDESEPPETRMYYAPLEKLYPKLSQQSIPRRRAYAALDTFLCDDPDFLRDNIDARDEAWEAGTVVSWNLF